MVYYSRPQARVTACDNVTNLGRAIAQAVIRWLPGFPPRRPGFDPGSGQVVFVVDKVALGQVFSEYFGFSCQSSFHQILRHHNHPGQATVCQSLAAVPSGPSWTPPPTMKTKRIRYLTECSHRNGRDTTISLLTKESKQLIMFGCARKFCFSQFHGRSVMIFQLLRFCNLVRQFRVPNFGLRGYEEKDFFSQ
jgi:hypothetical protein